MKDIHSCSYYCNRPECVLVQRNELRDKLAQLAEPEPEPVACFIGAKGSAFDLPTTKRAYTYAEQPGNVVASRLGLACNAAASQSAGDSIDRGLGLLQELKKQGFGVFDLGAEYVALLACRPLTDSKADTLAHEMVKGGKSAQWLIRAVESAHGIGGNDE